MTRINLVPPSELADQHLFAEFREIKMIPRSLERSYRAALKRGLTHEQATAWLLQTVPKEFLLGTGHVRFFYNKGHYLFLRYAVLRIELGRRGINFDRSAPFDPNGIFRKLGPCFELGYRPSDTALVVIRTRIAEKIAMKPNWYRWTSPVVTC